MSDATYDDILKEIEDEASLKREYHISVLRSNLFNQVTRKEGGCWQWRYITGKANHKTDGTRLGLDERVESILWAIVMYYQSEDGQAELREMGIPEPEHPDDIVSWVQGAWNYKERESAVFRYILKKYRKNPF